MYGFGGNARKPKRPQDMLDRTQTVDGFQQPSAPAPRVVTPMAELNPGTSLNRPQMERLPEMLTMPDTPVNVPNTPARPVSRDPIQRAREEAVYGGQMQADLDIKPKRGFWDIMKTAGVGALQGMASGGGLGGALGGALAGGIGHAIDPMAGRGYRFDVLQRPRMEADIQRGMAYDKFGREQMRGQAELEQTRAQTAKTRAEAAAMPGREELQRRSVEARIGRDEAQAQRYKQPPALRYTPEEERRRAERHQADIKRIDAQTQRALRPSVGRGGGGGPRPERPEKPTSLPSNLADAWNKVEQLRQEATRSWGQPEEDASGKPVPGSNAGETLRKQYVQALNVLKQQFPDFIEVREGVDEQGKPLRDWPYLERRR
jgi:hypothetical protein